MKGFIRIRKYGKWETIEIGQKVLVARCGSGRTYFGEFGTITRFTETQIVITTESGATVKTNENLSTIGKAKNGNYFVSTVIDGRENDKNFIKSKVLFWNEKKLCFENK